MPLGLIAVVVFYEFAHAYRWWFIGAMLAGAAAVPFTVGYVWEESWCGEKARLSARLVLACVMLSVPVGEIWKVISGRERVGHLLEAAVVGALIAVPVLAVFYLGRATKAVFGRRAVNRE